MPALHLDLLPREYPEHRAMEWQVFLKPSTSPSEQLLDDIQSANFELAFPANEAIDLHWNKGSHSQTSDFQPFTQQLASNAPVTLESIGGRSSDGVMPYFNLHSGDGGVIIALGWSGDWRATFHRTDSGVRITAGLKHSKILADNPTALRLPSLLMMSYQGDWLTGQNRFRKLMLEQFSPKNHAPLDLMPVAASVHGMIGFNDTNEENLTSLLQDIASLKLPIDTFWLDAGWNQDGFPAGQGNPDFDSRRFPQGLSSLGQAVQQRGLRFLVWFEPERVMRGTKLFREHPAWLLKPSRTPDEFRYLENDGFHLFDLANPEARNWMTAHISTQITESRVGIYRQDANLSPGYFWHTDVTPQCAAMREVLYINGLYNYLDALIEQHPKLIIDNCAAGGRRLDFEILRRSVVLWRSDSCWGDAAYPRNVQAMTHGLSLWLPLHGLGAAAADESALKSGMGACASFAINYRDPQSVRNLRRHLERYLPIRHVFTKNFYPLTPWTEDANAWLAFQFHDPVKQVGIVQAFRNPASSSQAVTLKLRDLDARQTYVLSHGAKLRSQTSRSC